MAVSARPRRAAAAAQVQEFRSGNEMAAISAQHIDFHVMGYYPITPSTEIAELLDERKAEGAHRTVMIPADGEHGAAGICYGASVGGGRVFNATSSQGLLYGLEQYPVQAGTRFPMLLDLATRSVSGPLDIRGDHSDLYYALDTGWLVLCARDPQAVYDLNVCALRAAEHPDVRLPALVAFDGFFTSHQKRRVSVFEDPAVVREFLGPFTETVSALDPGHPITVGPYMNDPDLINNKFQLNLAMAAALGVLPDVFAAYEQLSGRRYDLVDSYRMEDAEVALLLVNSAAETAKDAADRLREQGIRAGVLSPNVLRPFPATILRDALRGVRALVIGERADSYGSGGGPVSHEVKSALKDDPENATRCLTRIYGLGGRDFYTEDAEAFFRLALDALDGAPVPVFGYHGVTPGDPANPPHRPGLPPLRPEETVSGLVHVHDTGNGKLDGRGAARLAARGPPEARRARSRRLPRLRRVPGARPVPARDRGRRRRPLPDRLRDGRLDRLPVLVAPGHVRPQPVPERGGDALRPRRDVPRAQAARRAPRRRGHHLRDGHRRRRHGHRHGRRDRHRPPQPPPDHRRVRQPGLHEHGRAAELLDAARPPHLDEPRRPGRARQVVPPPRHAADHGGDEHPLRLHRRRGLPRRPAREGREGAVVRIGTRGWPTGRSSSPAR